MSFFRYPGGKIKLISKIVVRLKYIIGGNDLEYREPFFGGGSVGLELLKDNFNIKKIWINDKDPGVACLWTAVIKYPGELKDKVINFKPSVEYFDSFKEELSQNIILDKSSEGQIIELGFKKLAIHQISYSGLGSKSGGPLGGREQKSEYKIDCRWSPEYICNQIEQHNTLMKKIKIRNSRCTNLDFGDLIKENETDAILYLDPPYYVKGNELYQYGFTNEDHIRLAELLKYTKHKWLLSYDDCEEVRELYDWANIIKIGDINYTITTKKPIKKSELLITKEGVDLDELCWF